MIIFAETERLVLRELLPSDAPGMLELDGDPEVQKYLGKKPIATIEEARANIEFIRKQYIDNGIGRWAVIEKETAAFVGWAGLKFITGTINRHSRYYDLGYRFLKKHWGKGYATDAAKSAMQYGYDQLQLDCIYAMTESENEASARVLQKAGFEFIETFNHEHAKHNWYKRLATKA